MKIFSNLYVHFSVYLLSTCTMCYSTIYQHLYPSVCLFVCSSILLILSLLHHSFRPLICPINLFYLYICICFNLAYNYLLTYLKQMIARHSIFKSIWAQLYIVCSLSFCAHIYCTIGVCTFLKKRAGEKSNEIMSDAWIHQIYFIRISIRAAVCGKWVRF